MVFLFKDLFLVLKINENIIKNVHIYIFKLIILTTYLLKTNKIFCYYVLRFCIHVIQINIIALFFN